MQKTYSGSQGFNLAAHQALAAGVLHCCLILLGIGVVLPVLLNCTKFIFLCGV